MPLQIQLGERQRVSTWWNRIQSEAVVVCYLGNFGSSLHVLFSVAPVKWVVFRQAVSLHMLTWSGKPRAPFYSSPASVSCYCLYFFPQNGQINVVGVPCLGPMSVHKWKPSKWWGRCQLWASRSAKTWLDQSHTWWVKSVPPFMPCYCQRSVLVTEPTCLSPCAASLWGVVGSAIWPSPKGTPQFHNKGINISAGSCTCVQFQLAFAWLDGLLLTVSICSLWTESGFTQVLGEQQKGGSVHLKRRGFGSHL